MLENVKNLSSHDRGKTRMAIEKILHDLANLLLETESVDAKQLDELLGNKNPSTPPDDTTSGTPSSSENKNTNDWSSFNPGTTTALENIKE